LKEKITTLFFQKKTEKRKPLPQGRREGLSRLPIKKFLPIKIKLKEKTFFSEPEGLGLYCPVRRLIFAFLFWFLSFC
jgi:hypothetical protein